jgi:8-oxo-dGTP diphosphatase
LPKFAFGIIVSACLTQDGGEPLVVETIICLLLKGNPPEEILLGFKKRGFGAGKYTGVGGKVEPGETPGSAAVRELHEEIGVVVAEPDLRAAAHITFLFPARPEWSIVSYVYTTDSWRGTPVESAEVNPVWFPVDNLPFDSMWDDALYWLPLVLNGRCIRARFTFDDDNTTVGEALIDEWDGCL